MSEISHNFVLQKTSKNLIDVSKVQIKSETIATFGGIFHIMDVFERLSVLVLTEFEMGLSDILTKGLREGVSAETLGRMIRSRLNNPDAMYRRYHKKVTDDTGKKKVEPYQSRSRSAIPPFQNRQNSECRVMLASTMPNRESSESNIKPVLGYCRVAFEENEVNRDGRKQQVNGRGTQSPY